MGSLCRNIVQKVLSLHQIRPLAAPVTILQRRSELYCSTARYDVHNFRLPFTEAEKARVLHIINTASMEELTQYKLSKAVSSKMIAARNKKQKFEDLKELLFIEGIGMRKIDTLCERILNNVEPKPEPNNVAPCDQILEAKTHNNASTMYDPEPNQYKFKGNTLKKSVVKKRKYVVPKHDFESVSSIVGLSFKMRELSWCELVRTTPDSSAVDLPHLWCVTNIGSKKIETFKNDIADIYNQMVAAVDSIPVSSVYVMSDKETTSVPPDVQTNRISGYLATAHACGLLTVLLKGRLELQERDMEEEPSLYYAKEALALGDLAVLSQNSFVVGSDGFLSRVLRRQQPLDSINSLSVDDKASQSWDCAEAIPKYSMSVAMVMALTCTHLETGLVHRQPL